MRTKRFVSAALAAFMVVVVAACGDITNVNENNNNFPRDGTVIGSDTVSNGTCRLTYSLLVASPHTSFLGMQPGEVRRGFVNVDSLGSNCPPVSTFRWHSDDPLRVEVDRVNTREAHVTAVAPTITTTTICAESEQDASLRVCGPATVLGGPTGPVTISPASTSIANCAGFQSVWNLSASFNGASITGTWSSSNQNVATVNQSGVMTLTGTAGTAVITVQTASGSATHNVTVTQCTTGSCTVTSFAPTVPDISLTIGQQVQVNPNLASNPAGCATVSYTATGSVSVTPTGLVTGVSAGNGTVTVTPSVGTPVTLSFNVSGNNVVITSPIPAMSNCAGFQTTWNLGVTVNGTASSGTWSSSNVSVATVNQSTGVVTITGTAGTATITVQTSSGSATTTVTVNQCPGSLSVDVQPATFSLIVGQAQQLVLTATVSNAPAGQSTAVTWASFFVGTSTGAGNCVSLTPQGSNQVIVTPIAGCTQQIEVRATTVATVNNVPATDSSVGTVSSGNVTCVINYNGTTSGTITIAVNQTVSVTASCTNQNGAQFVPFWYVGAPPQGANPFIAEVEGATSVETIDGVQFPAGPTATITGHMAGQVTVYAQAAIRDTTVRASRPVVVQ